MNRPIIAWLSIGSTYTYLTALRLADIHRKLNLSLDIRPISIRRIMKSMDNIPFPPSKKAKVDYMWRDIERRADWYGLPRPTLPVPYPLQEFDRANTVGVLLNAKGRYLEYFEETYRLWFLEGLEAGSAENLERCITGMGLDYQNITAEASEASIIASYEANTDAAQAIGVFGAPSFSVGDEIFWGDDRLADAIRHAGNG